MKSIDQPNYKLTDNVEEPIDLDYDIYGLHKNRTFNQGELQQVDYYRNYNGETYSDLVVSESRTYQRNVMGLVEYRTQVSTWYLTDDSVGCTKTTIKYYNIQEAMQEAETRRSNLLSNAKLYTASQVGMENALDFMKAVNNEISLYIQGEQDSLLNAIQASTKPYLNPTIIGTLIYILTLND
jgi:hypothetical protein